MTSKTPEPIWLNHFGVVAGLLLMISGSACQPQNAKMQGEDSSKIVLVSDDEPGVPIIVSGTIYASDGKTPVPGATVYVYHTDNEGKYNWLGLRRSLRMPRIEGTMVTNSEGYYQFRSIKPAAYPNDTIKPHVHYKVEGDGYPEQKFKLSFEDKAENDPTGFNDHRRLDPDDKGILRTEFNLRLNPEYPNQ